MFYQSHIPDLCTNCAKFLQCQVLHRLNHTPILLHPNTFNYIISEFFSRAYFMINASKILFRFSIIFRIPFICTLSDSDIFRRNASCYQLIVKSPHEPRGKPIFYFLLKHLLNIGAGNGAREARIYFPISSFKAADTFQISRLFEECNLAFDCTI